MMQSTSDNSFIPTHSSKSKKIEGKPLTLNQEYIPNKIRSASEPLKPTKSVHFNPSVHVVLIPTVMEYVLAGLADLLWWSEADYAHFKHEAVQEMVKYMLGHTALNAKEVIRLLYQPNEEEQHEFSHWCVPKMILDVMPAVCSAVSSNSSKGTVDSANKPAPVPVIIQVLTSNNKSIEHLDAHSHAHLPLLPITQEHMIFSAHTISPERPGSTKSNRGGSVNTTPVEKYSVVDSVIDDLGPSASEHKLRRCDTSFLQTEGAAGLHVFPNLASNSSDTVDLSAGSVVAVHIRPEKKGISHLLPKKYIPPALKC